MNSYDLVCKVHEVPTFGPWMWAELLSRQWAERSLGILFICSRPGKGPVQFSSVAQLCWILFDPQGLQHTRLPCPSPTPGVYPNSCPSNHLIFCRPLLLLPSIFPSIRVFSNESALHIRWPKRWSFSFNISPSKEHSGLISFRMDWLDLPAVQGILKSLLQHHSSKASILRCSAFFIVQLSHLYMTTGKTIALTRRTFVGKVMSLLLNMLSRLFIAFLPRSKHLLISLISGKGPESLHFQLALMCGWHCCSETTFWAARLLDAVLKVHLKLMWQHFNSKIQVSTASVSILILNEMDAYIWHTSEKFMLLQPLNSLSFFCRGRRRCMRFLANPHLKNTTH